MSARTKRYRRQRPRYAMALRFAVAPDGDALNMSRARNNAGRAVIDYAGDARSPGARVQWRSVEAARAIPLLVQLAAHMSFDAHDNLDDLTTKLSENPEAVLVIAQLEIDMRKMPAAT